jgi:hypothetical protein
MRVLGKSSDWWLGRGFELGRRPRLQRVLLTVVGWHPEKKTVRVELENRDGVHRTDLWATELELLVSGGELRSPRYVLR